jgi:hypothetical protein
MPHTQHPPPNPPCVHIHTQAAAGWQLPPASKEGEEQARERLTVLIVTWLVRPHLEEATVDHLLGVLTDDMAGF